MLTTWTTRPDPRRPRRALALLTALTALAALALPTGGALASRPGPALPAPTPDRITVEVDGLDLPQASGTPDVLVLANADFAVTVTFRAGEVPAPYSTRTGTSVRLTASDGSTLATPTVAAGQSSVTVDGLRLPAANGVELEAEALGRKPAADLAPGTAAPFDVVLTAATIELTEAQRESSLFVTSATSGGPCQTSAAAGQQTCVDVLLPNGVGSDVFFSTGLCTDVAGCRPGGTVLQVLADLGERYSADAPATLVVRCDKSRCGGSGIKDQTLQVNLDPVGELITSPACGAKGVMDGPDGHCVDYVQSRRDGAGNTYLHLLITLDARMSH